MTYTIYHLRFAVQIDMYQTWRCERAMTSYWSRYVCSMFHMEHGMPRIADYMLRNKCYNVYDVIYGLMLAACMSLQHTVTLC